MPACSLNFLVKKYLTKNAADKNQGKIMNNFFIPGIKLINSLKYPKKFGLISLLLSLFIAALLMISIYNLNKEINLIEKQRMGIIFIEPSKALLYNIEEYRGLVRIKLLDEDSSVRPEMVRLESLVSDNLAQIQRLNIRYNNILGIEDNIAEISKKWKILKNNFSEIEKNFQETNNIVQKIYELIIEIGDESGLTLSKQIHHFYLIKSVTRDAPMLIHKMGKIKCLGAAALSRQEITDEKKLQIIIYIDYLKSKLEEINENTKKIIKEKEDLKNTFKENLIELNETVKSFINLIEFQIINPPLLNIEPTVFLYAGAKAMGSISGLHQNQTNVLDELLCKEIDKTNKLRLMLILPVFTVLLALAYVFSCFTLSIVNGVKYIQDKALKVAEGDLSVKSELETEDELKDLSDSLNKMIFSMRNLLKREHIIRSILLDALESTDIKSTLNTIVRNTAKLFDADRCFFVEYDAKNDDYLPIERHNSHISSLEVQDVSGIKLSGEEMKPVTDFVFSQKTVLAVDDANKLDLPIELSELIKKCNIKSFMVVPLFYAAEPIGLLLVESIKSPRPYKKEEVKLLESISYQSSIVIHQAKLTDQLRKKSNELEAALNNEKILRKIASESSLLRRHEDVDNYVLNEIMSIFKTNRVVHLHVDLNSLRWYGRKIRGRKTEILEGQCFVPADSADELIPSPDEILVFRDVEEEIKNQHLKNCLKTERIRSLMAYPTSKKFPGREEKGVIELTIIADSKPREWKTEERNLFGVIMDTLSIVTLETIQRRELEEARRLFMATLTHDLRSPLISEQKAIEFLLSPKAEKAEIDYKEYLKEIYNTNEDLLKLINNLLSTYHYESGKWKLNKSTENIETIIKEVINQLKHLAEENENEIICNIRKDIPMVSIDVFEIKRVLINLISNAIKHNEKGIKVSISAIKTDNYIQVSINDNGKGIPKEICSKLFHRYYTQKGKLGSGLGLYISKQIIEAHEGKIWVESEEGKGSTFYFTLPL